MSELNEKQRLFAHEYVVDLNGKQAAIRAGYSEHSARFRASQLLADPKVAALVESLMTERCNRLAVTPDRIVKELAKIAFSDIRDIASWDGHAVSYRSSDDIDDLAGAAIAEIIERTVESDKQSRREVRIKMHDKQRALELLGRHLGMWKDGAQQQQGTLPTREQLADLVKAARAADV